jgi:tRNA-modifying protein YgfZ
MATRALPELESQYKSLRGGGALVTRRHGSLALIGSDAVEFLQGQVTNDVEALEPGLGCYALLLNPKGRILADMRVLYRSNEELVLDTEASALDVLRSKLRMFKIGRQLEIEDRTEEHAVLSLIGPGARATLPVSPPEREHAFVEVEVEGTPALVVATDLGIDLILPSSRAGDVAAALGQRGAEEVSEEAAEIVRIESGRPRYGFDMSEDNLPGELGLEDRAVSFVKGCYVGQEPVARMHYRGHPNRHLRGLELSALATRGDAVTSADKQVGSITSAAVSPALGPIALAVLRREVEPKQVVAVGPGGMSATVVELPFEHA